MADRVAYEALLPTVQRCVVQIRGWDFPHLSNQVEIERQADWIGQSSEWEHLLEAWRFYQSGQFVDLSGIWEDWRDQSSLHPAGGDWRQGQTLGVGDALFRLTEIFVQDGSVDLQAVCRKALVGKQPGTAILAEFSEADGKRTEKG